MLGGCNGHARELCCAGKERFCREHKTRSNGAATVRAGTVHDVDVRCRTKVDDDNRAAITLDGSYGIGDAIGSDFFGILQVERHATAGSWPYKQGVVPQHALEAAQPGAREHRNNTCHTSILHLVECKAVHGKVAMQTRPKAIRGVGMQCGHTPAHEICALFRKEANRRLCVADINGQEHGFLLAL